MENKFRIRLCSDLEYAEMVIDIVWGTTTVAMLNQEKGKNNIEIEIFPSQDSISWKFPVDEFISTIELAKNKLIENRNTKK